MRKIYPQVLLVLSTLWTVATYSQDFSNKGKEFWFCFPNHIPSGANGSMSLWITSDKATSGTVTMTNGNFSATFNIPANGIQSINIPHNVAHISNGESGTVIQKSIKVKADPGKPAFVAYAQQYGNARSAATLLLPTTVLGKKYRAVSYTHTNVTGGGQSSRAQFQVIATKANTLVQVVPVLNGVRGNPFTISLPNVGDMYQYQAQQDITGTLIESVAGSGTSCSPIAVFSGNSGVTIGTTTCNGNSYDPLFQQNYPISTWGKNFGFIPFGDYLAGNPYRVLASEDNTTVSFNGSVVAIINAGEIYPGTYNSNPVTLTQPTSITADKPICVIQYAQTNVCSGSGNGDPDMVILNPIEQNIKDITIFSSTQQNIDRQWLNVLIKTSAAASFTIDGVAPSTAFQPAPNIPGYSYLQHLFSPAIQGSHILKADSGFNAVCYGFQGGQFESYAYSAGTNVKDLYQQIAVSSQYAIEPTPSICKGSPFRFKVSLPYCADSIEWDLSLLPGPPVPTQPKYIYTSCTPGPNGPDSTTVVNGKTIYWYSIPNIYTISTSGTFPVTITTYSPNTDGCGSEQNIDFELTVYDEPVADFSFTAPGCAAQSVQFTDITTTPRPSYIWNWNFGDPASGANNTASTQNPTHSFSGPGTYTVTFNTITTPGCVSAQVTKTVVVPANPTATISTSSTTACINTSPGPVITFTANGGTAPYTFTYNINGGPAQTISTTGTSNQVTLNVPTTTGGTFTYNLVKVQNTGSTICFTDITNTNVVINVNSNAVMNLTSPASTANQAVCQGATIADIIYTIGSGGTGATVTGLPAGVNGVFNNGVFTISGSPTSTPGTYNYTVTTTGPCNPSSLSGSIIINPDAAITLSSAGGTDNQQVCNGASLTNITYAVTGGGTGASVTGLPAGVTGTYSSGVFTIGGSPSANGTFNYTVTTTGTCGQRTATGTITVNPNPTLTLTSASSTANQTVCETSPIINIVYTIANATGVNVSGLPSGVSSVYSGGILTISGTPTGAATYNFTVTTTGPCTNPNLAGSIIVTAGPVVSLTSATGTNAQELCRNVAITNITYSVTGGSGTTVTGLPSGVTGSLTGNTFTISGTPTQSGTFNYTVSTTSSCGQSNAIGTLTINALPTADFSFSSPGCENRAINFTNASVPNSGTITTYSWNFGDPASGPNNTSSLQNPTHTFASAGTYTVTLNVTTDKGCTNPTPFTRTVTINVNPNAEFTVPNICAIDVGVFTDNSTIAAPNTITGYEWNFGDPASGAANTSITQHGSHTFSAGGTYTVTHMVFSNSGCSDTTQHTVTISGNPFSDFGIQNASPLCANDSVSITNLATVSPGSITKVEIYWDNVGQPTVFDTDNSPTAGEIYRHLYPNFQTPLTRTFDIRYRAYSGGTCVKDTIKTITVNAAPRVQFNNIPDVCPDAAPFQITQASETGGVPGTGVFSGPGVSSTGLFTPTSVGPGTYTIKFTYTSNAGCVDTLSRTITVVDSASARFTFNPLICDKTSVNFNSSTSTAGSGTITAWSWNFGDPASGAANTSTQQNPSHLFTTWGTYNVTLTVTTSTGCRSTVRTIPVIVNPIPRASFTFPASACLPSATIQFNNNSTIADGSQPSLTYLWNFGDPGSGANNTSSGSNPSHIYTSAGPFSVNLQVTSGAGCVHDTTIVVNNIHPEPTGLFTATPVDVCVGQSISFTDNSNAADGTTVQWNWDLGNGNTRNTPSFSYTYPAAGTFDVKLYITNSHGCRSTTHTQTVTVNPYPIVDAGPDLFILEGGSDTLQPVVTATVPSFLWSPNQYFVSSNTIQNAVVKGVADITYTLTVTGRGGCIASDQVKIFVLKGPEIPNIFSPNGDGIHDVWQIKYLDTYPGGTVEVFNRYGQRLFRSVGYSQPWDGTVNGKPVPMGTYYYVVDPKNGREIMSGYVDIIR